MKIFIVTYKRSEVLNDTLDKLFAYEKKMSGTGKCFDNFYYQSILFQENDLILASTWIKLFKDSFRKSQIKLMNIRP